MVLLGLLALLGLRVLLVQIVERSRSLAATAKLLELHRMDLARGVKWAVVIVAPAYAARSHVARAAYIAEPVPEQIASRSTRELEKRLGLGSKQVARRAPDRT